MCFRLKSSIIIQRAGTAFAPTTLICRGTFGSVTAVFSIPYNGIAQDCKWLFTLQDDGKGVFVEPAKRTYDFFAVIQRKADAHFFANVSLQLGNAGPAVVFSAKRHLLRVTSYYDPYYTVDSNCCRIDRSRVRSCVRDVQHLPIGESTDMLCISDRQILHRGFA